MFTVFVFEQNENRKFFVNLNIVYLGLGISPDSLQTAWPYPPQLLTQMTN